MRREVVRKAKLLPFLNGPIGDYILRLTVGYLVVLPETKEERKREKRRWVHARIKQPQQATGDIPNVYCPEKWSEFALDFKRFQN